MVIFNKKGMDISLNFVILAVLALIALIIIALFFTGGLTNLFGQTSEVGSISSEKVALYASKCDFYCTTHDKAAWNDPGLPAEFSGTKYANTNPGTACQVLTGKSDYDTVCCAGLTDQELIDCTSKT